MASILSLSRPIFGEKENQYLNEALASGMAATSGPFIEAFESALEKSYPGMHIAALNSGTSAIHLALRLLGVGKGDTVICQSFTFCASANPILYQGAEPIFVDSEQHTWNICPNHLKDAIEDLKKKGKKPKAIIAVDLFGMPADWDALMEISQKENIPILEDAAEAMGSSYKGQACGTLGELGVFSFNGNKIMTTGGGGALLSGSFEEIKQARHWAVHARETYKYYLHHDWGYNYRMNNLSAGIGLVQFETIEKKVSARRTNYAVYQELLKEFEGIELPNEPEGCFSNRWLSTILIDQERTGFSNEDLRLAFLEEQIESRYLWNPLHLQPVFKSVPFYGAGTSEKLFNMGLCLPSSEDLKQEDRERVYQVIKKLYRK